MDEGCLLVLLCATCFCLLFILAKQRVYVRSSRSRQKGKQREREEEIVDETNSLPLRDGAIFYGSETGTAEFFSFILTEMGKKREVTIQVIDLGDFSPVRRVAFR